MNFFRTELKNLFDKLRAEVMANILANSNGTEYLAIRKNTIIVEPVIDGVTIPDYPPNIYGSTESADVDVLVGYTSEDGRCFTVPLHLWGKVNEEQFNSIANMWGNPAQIKDIYCKEWPNDLSQLLSSLWTDSFFRLPVLRVAESNIQKKKKKAYVYCFSLPSPAFENGASHTCELPFVFHQLDLKESEMILKNFRPVELADRMNKCWADFIRDGHPGWPEYDMKSRTLMDFNVESKIMKDTFPLTRKFWDDLR